MAKHVRVHAPKRRIRVRGAQLLTTALKKHQKRTTEARREEDTLTKNILWAQEEMLRRAQPSQADRIGAAALRVESCRADHALRRKNYEEAMVLERAASQERRAAEFALAELLMEFTS